MLHLDSVQTARCDSVNNTMLTDDAIYRFNRSSELRYYRAAYTSAGVAFLYPISVGGSRIADQHPDGRRYVILYFMTKWGKFAAAGYWLRAATRV